MARPEELKQEDIQKWESQWPELKAINDATLDKPRGFVISMADLIALAKCDDKLFKKAISRWKAALLAVRGITVVYDHKHKGYRYTTVKEMLDHRNEKIMKSLEERCRKEAVRLAVIRDGDLESDHQRKMRVLLIDQHTRNRGTINSQREFARLSWKEPDTLPKVIGG